LGGGFEDSGKRRMPVAVLAVTNHEAPATQRMSIPSLNIAQSAAKLLSLEAKVAMVTGAASGIGRGIALRLAEMGAFVAVLDVDEAGSAQTETEIRNRGGEAFAIRCDVSNSNHCRQATERVVQRRGKVDILSNCAGIIIRKDVLDLSDEEWDRTLDVTLKGIYLLSREVIPHMIRRGGGSIINIGSGWSLKGGPRAASYCAAKGGTLNLTRAMAIDHGRHNIRVNCVCPGDVDTPMLRSECIQLGEDMQKFMTEAAHRPLARLGTPGDIANAVLFLASPMSNWITGAALVVDGGGLA
jgi:NAD(P)-dependent dehydrogenase (short-subunit alcohol dehydrogenase family)